MKKVMVLAIMMLAVTCLLAQAETPRETELIQDYSNIINTKQELQEQLMEINKQLLRLEGAILEVRLTEKIAKEALEEVIIPEDTPQIPVTPEFPVKE